MEDYVVANSAWIQFIPVTGRHVSHGLDKGLDQVPQVVITMDLCEGRQKSSASRIASKQVSLGIYRIAWYWCMKNRNMASLPV
jgi:hypothetical protein